MPIDREQARREDEADPLRELRARFVLPERGVYLAGNSLGPMPKTVPDRVAEVSTRQWGEGRVRSWNAAGWFALPRTLGFKLAPLLGASADDVIVTDSISINLYKVVTALRARWPERPRVLVEHGAFPPDRYVISSAAGQANIVELA